MPSGHSIKIDLPPRVPLAPPAPFSEASTWAGIGRGWRQIFGGFQVCGFSFEWHDFQAKAPLDWGGSFHPESIEICLNLEGTATVSTGPETANYRSNVAGFYRQGSAPLVASRQAGVPHRFISVEYSPDFIRRHFIDYKTDLHPMIADVMEEKKSPSALVQPQGMNSEHHYLLQSLRRPTVFVTAQRVWYESKALEIAALFFFQPRPEQQLFCNRQKNLSEERVQKVVQLLRQHLSQPLLLEELGKKVGCSPFYLSRTFSRETGITISQFQRKLRLERAAELLRSGQCNVTEAALEVGYSSLSHFSHSFHETFGCCPGLYPLNPRKLPGRS